MSMKPLPRFVSLKSAFNNKYLLLIHDEKEDVDINGFLQYSGKEIMSPYMKYEVESAKTEKEGLVHLKSCYNNKYWVRAADDTNWIIAGADEKEENESKWSCTLFEPIYVDAATIRFRHVQLGNYASLWRVDESSDVSYFYAGSATPNIEKKDISIIVDWDSLVILPKRVAFKDIIGRYLVCCGNARGDKFLQCQEGSANVQRQAWHEIFPIGDGSVRIKAMYYPYFWKCGPNWVGPEQNDSTTDVINPDTLFWPTKAGHNVVTLKYLINNQFTGRLTLGKGGGGILKGALSPNDAEPLFVVEEVVISRTNTLVDHWIYSI